jgi:hypothetical protein
LPPREACGPDRYAVAAEATVTGLPTVAAAWHSPSFAEETQVLVRRPAAAALVAVSVVVLTACGAGKTAQTQRDRNTTTGWSVDLENGDLQVRDVYATPTAVGSDRVLAGGGLDLHFHVYNRTDTPELLIGLDSASGTSVAVSSPGSPSAPIAIAPRNSVAIGGAASGPTAQIRGLKATRFVGTYVQLTMTFARAGGISMTIPIEDAVSAPVS